MGAQPGRRLKNGVLHAAVCAVGLPPTHAALMHQIISHCDTLGGCFPTIARLADRTGISYRQAQRVFHDLREGGLFTTRPITDSYMRVRLRPGTRTQGRLAIELAPAGKNGSYWRSSWSTYWTRTQSPAKVTSVLQEPTP